MDATREDLVQFISAIRCELVGPNGQVGDPVQAETLDQIKRQLARLTRRKKRTSTVYRHRGDRRREAR